jgi:predicted permease
MELPPGQAAPRVGYNRVSPNYFETMGIPLVRGRGFGAHDRRAAPSVVIINETMARRFWGGSDPLGQRVRLTDGDVWGDRGPSLEVIGVAKDITYRSYGEPPRPFMYLALEQDDHRGGILHVRTGGDPRAVLAALRRAVRAVDPYLPVTDLATLDERIGFSLTPQRVAARVLGVSGLFALALAAVGLYGVVAYAAAQRTREIAVRLAVGATRADVLRLVARSALTLTALGLAAGVPAAAGATKIMTHMLYGVSRADPATYAAAATLIALVTVAATVGPARRAMRVNPASALHTE